MYILIFLVFILNILLFNYFEVYTIVFEFRIKNYFFCEYFFLMLIVLIGFCSVIFVMLVKLGCDDILDK